MLTFSFILSQSSNPLYIWSRRWFASNVLHRNSLWFTVSEIGGGGRMEMKDLEKLDCGEKIYSFLINSTDPDLLLVSYYITIMWLLGMWFFRNFRRFRKSEVARGHSWDRCKSEEILIGGGVVGVTNYCPPRGMWNAPWEITNVKPQAPCSLIIVLSRTPRPFLRSFFLLL
jgi:hypothetical protein